MSDGNTVLYYQDPETKDYEIRIFYADYYVLIDHSGVEVDTYDGRSREVWIELHLHSSSNWMTFEEL